MLGTIKMYIIAFLAVLVNLHTSCAGPIWPNTFRVEWSEIAYNDTSIFNQNNGAWYYDWKNNRARFDHLEGQKDMFCPGNELSPDKPQDDCHLIFPPNNEMFAHYPNQKTCCRMCAVGYFCSPIKPDWIENGIYKGTEQILGRECNVWYEDGSFSGNYWMETADGEPCRFWETSPLGDSPTSFKNITYDPDTYSTEPIPDSVFDVPEYCYKDCKDTPFPPPSNDLPWHNRFSIV